MLRIPVLAALIYAVGSFTPILSQEPPSPSPDQKERSSLEKNGTGQINGTSERIEGDAADAPDTGATSTSPPPGYVRPTAEVRFKRYVNSTIGPTAIARNLVTAGITTGRNTPKEWGGQWEGFGRRFASQMSKNAIEQTVTYGLDEALEVDSHFYLSPNRHPKSRFYNAVISTVTARKPNGRRVVGVPRIVGSFSSGVVASQVWYPDRYDYVHGLKGGAITLGLNAAFNLFREFVLKK